MPGTILNIENVTNLYLFGTTTRPSDLASDAFIRPQGDGAHVTVDGAQFMSQGGGRFAVGAAFEVIQNFFEDSTLAPGVYSKLDLTVRYNLSRITLNIKQYELDDGGGDYQERVYIYNQTAFQISALADFVVNSDGSKEIRNYSIVPFGEENFDFTGSNPVINFFQSFLLEEKIDPSEIGRKVVMNFDLSGIAGRTYTYQDYAFETVKWSQFTHVSNIAGLFDMPSVVDDLHQAGSIDYRQDGMIVRWLTNGDDGNVGGGGSPATAAQIAVHEIVGQDAASGQIVMMGAGSDQFVVDWGDSGARFEMHGGAGIDTVTSLDPNDSYWSIKLEGVEYFNGSIYTDNVEFLSGGTIEGGVLEVRTGGGSDSVNIHGGNFGVIVDLGDGDDFLSIGELQESSISGGAGNDYISFENYTHGISVTFDRSMFYGDYLLVSFEGLIGTSFDDQIAVENDFIAGGEGNDTLYVVDGSADGGGGDDTLYAAGETGEIYGGDGYDIAHVTGHINPYSGYFDFEEVHATLENDYVDYTDGTRGVYTWGGDDVIDVTLRRSSPSSVDHYYVDGGDGMDTLVVQRETGGNKLTAKSIELILDGVEDKDIAWVIASGERQVTPNGMGLWYVESGFSRYELSIEKASDYETNGTVKVGYGYIADLRLEADSPGFAFGVTLIGYSQGDLGISF